MDISSNKFLEIKQCQQPGASKRLPDLTKSKQKTVRSVLFICDMRLRILCGRNFLIAWSDHIGVVLIDVYLVACALNNFIFIILSLFCIIEKNLLSLLCHISYFYIHTVIFSYLSMKWWTSISCVYWILIIMVQLQHCNMCLFYCYLLCTVARNTLNPFCTQDHGLWML
jgi:hypothetical protein